MWFYKEAGQSMDASLIEKFRDIYGGVPTVTARAPGRLEILGNHTDYNEGVVLSVAVDCATWFAARRTDGGRCTVYDVRDDESMTFAVSAPDEVARGSWICYIAGIVKELQLRGITVPAFEAALVSTIPMSAGMSSSAALEISTALALGKLCDVELPWQEWARIGQACENNTVGARTGLLDQFSSLRGLRNHLVFSDFRSLEVNNAPLPENCALVVANSMVKHNLTGEYNERRARCEEAVAELSKHLPGVTALRDVSRSQLDAHKDKLDVMAFRRALHVVGENERVFKGIDALENQDLRGFGRLMFQSHESSRLNFENSCPELDALIDIGQSLPGCIGARLSGGGFGGISVHLVEEKEAEGYCRRLGAAYASLTGKEPQIMICHAGDGAAVLE